MCKEGWFVRLGQEGVAWGWGELSEIVLKREGQTESGVGVLKGVGGWNSLTNCDYSLKRVYVTALDFMWKFKSVTRDSSE